MELRKNPKIDLERKRGMFLSIGLFLSISFVLMAFQWTTEVAVVDFDPEEEELDRIFTAMIDPVVTYMDQPKRPEPIVKKKVVSLENIVEADEEETVEEELFVEEPIDDFEGIVDETPLPEEFGDTIFEGVVETMPEPIGGMGAFYKFMGKEMKYPKQARRMNISGKVFVQFVIGKSGEISDVKVIKGIGGGCDEEAKRVVSESPNWNPGKQRGRPVNVRMVVPVFFRLQ